MRFATDQPDHINLAKNSLRYRIATFLLALAYGGFLTSLPLYVFKDRSNYLEYAAHSWEILGRYSSQGPLVVLSNEPVWLLINSCLANFFSADVTLRIIIFVPAVVVAWVVLQRSPKNFIWLLLFLMFPSVIKNHIIHLRQGLAIAVFLLGWFSANKPTRWLLIAIAPFIHASFFFVLGLLGLARMSTNLRLGPDIRTLSFTVLGIATGLAIGWIAELVVARQAHEYEFAMIDVSGIGFIFWGLVFVVMCLQGRSYMRSYAFELGTIIYYISTYFFIVISARIFESSLILVLLAGLHLTGWRRAAFLALISLSAVMEYVTRFDLPWLGFGI